MGVALDELKVFEEKKRKEWRLKNK